MAPESDEEESKEASIKIKKNKNKKYFKINKTRRRSHGRLGGWGVGFAFDPGYK